MGLFIALKSIYKANITIFSDYLLTPAGTLPVLKQDQEQCRGSRPI